MRRRSRNYSKIGEIRTPKLEKISGHQRDCRDTVNTNRDTEKQSRVTATFKADGAPTIWAATPGKKQKQQRQTEAAQNSRNKPQQNKKKKKEKIRSVD